MSPSGKASPPQQSSLAVSLSSPVLLALLKCSVPRAETLVSCGQKEPLKILLVRQFGIPWGETLSEWKWPFLRLILGLELADSSHYNMDAKPPKGGAHDTTWLDISANSFGQSSKFLQNLFCSSPLRRGGWVELMWSIGTMVLWNPSVSTTTTPQQFSATTCCRQPPIPHIAFSRVNIAISYPSFLRMGRMWACKDFHSSAAPGLFYFWIWK